MIARTLLILKSHLLVIVTVIFACLRLYDVSADFPSGITRSGALYTDEGTYLAAALSRVVEGNWHTLSTMNLAVTMPLGQIIVGTAWEVFGMSISVARITIAVCCIVLIGLTYLLLIRYMSQRSAIFVVALLSTNPFLFAYSRIALYDIMMTTFVVLALVIGSRYWHVWPRTAIGVAAIVLWLACLVKSSGVFAVPLLAYIVGSEERDRRKQLILVAECILVFSLLYGAYGLLVRWAYPLDVAYNTWTIWGLKTPKSLLHFITNPIKIVGKAYRIGVITVVATLVLTAFLSMRSAAFRSDVAVRFSVLWIVLFGALQATTMYHPPRYYVPVVIPILVLLVRSCDHLTDRFTHRAAKVSRLVLLVGLIVVNAATIVVEMKYRNHSFLGMVRGVEETIARTGIDPQDATLVGVFAHTISLETKIPAICSIGGRSNLAQKLTGNDSAFYVTMGSEPAVEDSLRRVYRFHSLGQWDVFGNYYTGQPVRLYQLWRDRSAIAREDSRIPG